MDKQKHIVLFIHALTKGGAERVMVNIAKTLVQAGVKVTLVTQYVEADEYQIPELVERVISEIDASEITSSRIHNFVARYQKLRGILKELHPNLVLAFLGKNNLMAIAATLFTDIPVVVSVRGEPKSEYSNPAVRWSAKLLFPLAEGIVFQTRQAGKFFPLPARRKSVILRNPLNPSFVKPRFQGERDGRIVSVGRFTENKNHKMMLLAFAGIAEEFPDAKLVFYGDGETKGEIKSLAEALGISGRVEMPGAITNVADRIYTASVFLLASFHEGMPNALIEAMCMGIPSISTDCPCGGPAELIRHGENGFLVPVGGVKEMEHCLRKLLSDRLLAEQISIQSAMLLESFDPQVVNKDWREYLLSKCR